MQCFPLLCGFLLLVYHPSPPPTATEDYTAITSRSIVFQPGQTHRPFTVEIVPDELPEPSEFFNVMSNTSQPRVSLTTPSLALVEIADDDSECTAAVPQSAMLAVCTLHT